MALIGIRRKKDEKEPCRACGREENTREKTDASRRPEAEKGVCCIRVLGTGCKSCRELLGNTKAAVAALGLSVEVEYVTDMERIMSYGVMRMPALVVNESVVSMGRVLRTAEIESLLRTL